METKRCSMCKKKLPVNMFGKNKSRPDGMQSFCKPCMREYSHKYNIENRHKRKAYKLEYNRTHSAQNMEWEARYKEINPMEYKSRTALGNAIRDGKINRPQFCSKCGKKCTPDGHHPDYSRPLHVIWLCRSCHGRLHKKILRESQSYSDSEVNTSMESSVFHCAIPKMSAQ